MKTHARFFPAPYVKNLRAALGHCRGIGDPKCEIKTDADLASASPVYHGESSAEDFWREQREVYDQRWLYDSFLYWRNPPFHGNQINVSETAFGNWRDTTPSPKRCAGQTLIQVWVFGGSVVFGVGTPDSLTWPSQLSDELNARGQRCYSVTNFGVRGYNSNQELLLLVRQLQMHKPDIVVFYDGFNDAYVGAHNPADASSHMDKFEAEAAQQKTFAAHLDFVNRSSAVTLARVAMSRLQPGPSASGADLPKLSRDTLDAYEKNVDSIRALGVAYGFESFFYWQPWLLSRDRLTPQEKAVADNPQMVDPDEHFFAEISAVYAEAERRSADGRFTLMTHVFDGQSVPIFIDEVHTGPLGSKLVAHRIAADIPR